MKNIAKCVIINLKGVRMSVAKQIRSYIDTVEDGKIFTYADLPVNNKSAAAPVLSRMETKGDIKRLSKGKYYKPKEGMFGKLPPSDAEVLQSYMKDMGNAYITGLKAFNIMGLTTQVPNVISIAGNGSARKIKVKNMTIEVFELKSSIERDDIGLAQMLDALDKIKKIPDTTPDNVVLYTKKIMADLSKKEKDRLAVLAKERRPRTRAIIGAILKELGEWQDAYMLKETLNPLSSYKVGLSYDTLKEKSKWKIL